MADASAAWPLDGIRVLDLGQIYNGPYAGFLLAHAGADVVKVEPPGGEALRKRGGLGVPMSFAMLNTNKRGLIIDLKHPRGKALLIELVREADVFTQGYRPGTLGNRGLSPEELAQIRPGLVYVSLCAFSHVGPWASRRGFDTVVQTVSGITSRQGDL